MAVSVEEEKKKKSFTLEKSEEAFSAAKVKINHYSFDFLLPLQMMGFDCNVNLRSLVSNFDLLRPNVCGSMNMIVVFVDLGLSKVLKLFIVGLSLI